MDDQYGWELVWIGMMFPMILLSAFLLALAVKALQWLWRLGTKAGRQLHKPEPRGDVVISRDLDGNILAVTRQDAEGRVLSVLAIAPSYKDPRA